MDAELRRFDDGETEALPNPLPARVEAVEACEGELMIRLVLY